MACRHPRVRVVATVRTEGDSGAATVSGACADCGALLRFGPEGDDRLTVPVRFLDPDSDPKENRP